MSLYREARGRRIWPLAAIALVATGVGFGIGLLVSAGEEEPSVEAAVADLRAELAPAISALELVTIEYPQAFESGPAAAETELSAASSSAERARTAVASVDSDLAALDPSATERVVEQLDELVAQIDAEADPRRVEALATSTSRTLERTVGE